MASSTNLFGFEQIEPDSSVNATLIFEEINKELGGYLLEKSIDTDSTGGVFDCLESWTNRVQEDFDKLIGEDSVKKRFIRVLTRIFVLLLNTKINFKIKKILKIAAETTLKI